MGYDGVCYLDISDAYLRGDWRNALNGYWSPLYSWILGFFLALLRPTLKWEFPVVHLADFLIYLISLGAFEFCLNGVIRAYQQRASGPPGHPAFLLPEWALRIWGYVLFIWTSLQLIQMKTVTPDMAVAAWTYLAVGIVLRVQLGDLRRGLFVALGTVLGLGFLTKAIMLPLSLVIFLAAFSTVPSRRTALLRLVEALFCFTLVVAPFVAALSLSQGRLTLGDSPRLNYGWNAGTLVFSAETPRYAGWIRAKKISESPLAYGSEINRGGTFPEFYDPASVLQEAAVRFDGKRQWRTFLKNMRFYRRLFVKDQWGPLILCPILLFWLGVKKGGFLIDMASQRILIASSVALLGIYSLVVVETRYIGAAVLLLLLALFCSVAAGQPVGHWRKPLTGALLAFSLWTIGPMILKSADNVRFLWRDMICPEDSPTRVNLHAAEAFIRLGIHPGDKVALIGNPPVPAFWARLARVQITAYVKPDQRDGYWAADKAAQTHLHSLLAGCGMKALVLADVPPGVTLPRSWARLGNTHWQVTLLPGTGGLPAQPALITTGSAPLPQRLIPPGSASTARTPPRNPSGIPG